MNDDFTHCAAQGLRLQCEHHGRQNWLESIALGRAALESGSLTAEEARESSAMLCEASLNAGDSALMVQCFAAHVRQVADEEQISRLVQRLCHYCTVDQVFPVFATLPLSAFEWLQLTIRLHNERRFAHAEALGVLHLDRFPDLHGADIARILGWVNMWLCRYPESMAFFERSLALSMSVETLLGTAYLLCQMGRYDDALVRFAESSRLKPIDVEHCRVVANALFGAGRVKESMQTYELRLTDPTFIEHAPKHLPQWTGEPLDGRLLVLFDIGWSFGDFLMYSRYIGLLRSRAKTLRVRTPPAMERVLRASFPDVEIETNDAAAERDCDAWLWVMSSPVLLGTYSTAGEAVPWLKTSEAHAQHWANQVRHHVQHEKPQRRRRIGICWRGNPNTLHDLLRSARLDDFTPLFEGLHDVDWFNLQLGVSERPPEDMLASRGSRWMDPMPAVNDFADTAAIVAQLDLVVTIDSAVAHLCLSSGARVIVLVPVHGEWRWQTGDTTPWYPHATLARTPVQGTFRQTMQRLLEEQAFEDLIAGE
ncbi:TPR repeat-containing protein [Caballeronia pedi]|uniref:TPR repeat-containing protein n=1 Tax=Caballeronia pedi TaxID=1777141 RepID=A0A157Z4V0_9BURK|nr:tetratricopeptide repeat protein [Caballeronia pedi]SAK40555.1 TPR repeat-containing protein [Caballeronia pedi]